MKLLRDKFVVNDIEIPCITIENGQSRFSAIVVHGYGGNKEEMLGLSFAVSEAGMNVYTIDLRGHGENSCPYDGEVFEDFIQIVKLLSAKGKVIAIGHSLGGRLALLSDADIRIGISPALSRVFSEQTVSALNNLRKYRVRESAENVNSMVVKDLPLAENNLKSSDLVLYGTRDVPEIKASCSELKKTFDNVLEIPNALHSDIVSLNATFQTVKKFITHTMGIEKD